MDEQLERAIAKNEALGLPFRIIKLYSLKTGFCPETCAFCGQSSLVDKKYKVTKKFSTLEEIQGAIENATQNESDEIVFVSSGTRLCDTSELTILAKGITQSKEAGLEVSLDLGLMSSANMQRLHDVGAETYFIGFQTAKSFFPKIIKSHNYTNKVTALEAAQKAGYKTRGCAILGLGESESQRHELASEFRAFGLDSVGLSLFQPMKGSTMENHPKLSSEEAITAIALIRESIDIPVYLLGGRERIIAEEHMSTAFQLINGTTAGGYLFTSGDSIEKIIPYIRQIV